MSDEPIPAGPIVNPEKTMHVWDGAAWIPYELWDQRRYDKIFGREMPKRGSWNPNYSRKPDKRGGR